MKAKELKRLLSTIPDDIEVVKWGVGRYVPIEKIELRNAIYFPQTGDIQKHLGVWKQNDKDPLPEPVNMTILEVS